MPSSVMRAAEVGIRSVEVGMDELFFVGGKV